MHFVCLSTIDLSPTLGLKIHKGFKSKTMLIFLTSVIYNYISSNTTLIYYMQYHGGTNLGRTGAAYVTTSYYDQSPLDEYGIN